MKDPNLMLTNLDVEALKTGVFTLVRNPREFEQTIRNLLGHSMRPKGPGFRPLVEGLQIQCRKVFNRQMSLLLAQAQECLDRANTLCPELKAHVPDDLERLSAVARFLEEQKTLCGAGALASLLNDGIVEERARHKKKAE